MYSYDSEEDDEIDLIIPSVTPKRLRKLIQSRAWKSDAGALAIRTVESQLKAYEKRPARKVNVARETDGRVPSLFDTSAKKLAESIGELAGTEDSIKALVEMEGLSPNILNHIALMVDMPYYLFCKARELSDAEDDGSAVDEWVLRNEVWLREGANADRQASSKRFRTEGKSTSKRPKKPDWTLGLVRLSVHADAVFAGSKLTDTSRIITRSTSLTGFSILDGRRSAAIRIQPSVEAFSTQFDTMTDGLLKGLDWDHVFVAGGIVLGSLLCTDDKESTNSPDQWKTSDVDLYIHGLGPVDANKKIEYIFSVFKSNLPKNAPVLVVRNSKTITFFSKFPLRRIQVVLKLVDYPKDVLLNFDLDICAIGWDGKEVWMLPRAARALQTGYTVFTMDLINGHYLGDRRATQEERVFKYADKGYGIRILPSYMTELRKLMDDPEKLQMIGEDHRYWGQDEVNEPWNPQSFEKIVKDAREWTARKIPSAKGGVPTKVTHLCLQNRFQVTEDPQRRSVLSGLTLFMRHVALWEREVAGDVIIEKNSWAAPLYDNFYANYFGVGYNDTPDYAWDAEFTTKGFIEKLVKFNQIECKAIDECLSRYSDRGDSYSTLSSNMKLESDAMVPNLRAQRIIYATSVKEILQPKCDIYLPVWLPEDFIEFANQLLPEAIRNSGVLDYKIKPFKPAIKGDVDSEDEGGEDIQLVIWRITSITMWQQLNRAVDEIHEMIWSFHQANAAYLLEAEDRLKILVTLLARRAIRLTAQDEHAAFARWVLRKPVPLSRDHRFTSGPSISYGGGHCCF